ncbi:MAG: hypothetical protein U0931_39135 [Vulcanimicrobiota bacterium]
MNLRVAILGFEPALRSALRSLLSREPGLQLAEENDPQPDILLIAPSNPEWVNQLRQLHPQARIVAMVEWHRRSGFADAAVDEFVDSLDGYQSLLKQIRSGS